MLHIAIEQLKRSDVLTLLCQTVSLSKKQLFYRSLYAKKALINTFSNESLNVTIRLKLSMKPADHSEGGGGTGLLREFSSVKLHLSNI